MRLRVPDEGETVVEDLIRGEVRFPNRSYDDFVIARGDGSVLYNFAVAVDDAEMGISEVVRGDDHLSNTPKQLLVLEALGHEPPRYAHLPLLHGPDGKKLSKRHGAASVQELRDAGYLPGGGPQLPGAARLGNHRRHHADVDRGAGRALPGRGRRALGGDLRREEAALDQRPLHAGDAALRLHRGGRSPPRPRARRAPARRLRDRPGESADARRGLGADPLPLRAPGRRRKGLEQGDEGGDPAAVGSGPGRPRCRRRLRPGLPGGCSDPPRRRTRRQAGQALSADSRRDHRQHRLTRHLRVAFRARARRNPSLAWTPRLPAFR